MIKRIKEIWNKLLIRQEIRKVDSDILDLAWIIGVEKSEDPKVIEMYENLHIKKKQLSSLL